MLFKTIFRIGIILCLTFTIYQFVIAEEKTSDNKPKTKAYLYKEGTSETALIVNTEPIITGKNIISISIKTLYRYTDEKDSNVSAAISAPQKEAVSEIRFDLDKKVMEQLRKSIEDKKDVRLAIMLKETILNAPYIADLPAENYLTIMFPPNTMGKTESLYKTIKDNKDEIGFYLAKNGRLYNKGKLSK
jgi:hypothetical protein